jgi:hypothetical protein
MDEVHDTMVYGDYNNHLLLGHLDCKEQCDF